MYEQQCCFSRRDYTGFNVVVPIDILIVHMSITTVGYYEYIILLGVQQINPLRPSGTYMNHLL
jgi:hypothetical protein